MIELESLLAFDTWVGEYDSLTSVAIQGLDLTGRTAVLERVDVEGSFFLGCLLDPAVLSVLNDGGALVFPRFPDLPFRAFRGHLYSAADLYAGYVPGDPDTYDTTLDGRTYVWHKQVVENQDVIATLAERVHDHAIDDALNAVLDEVGQENVVAIMGGHSMARDSVEYAEVARLGRELTRVGLYVATGGGPGAMEAANLGAWMAPHADDDLDAALEMLAVAPGFTPVGDWLDTAFAVRERWPQPVTGLGSLGVPTWHYGHEPPNVFASEIAKYFANAIREEGLLAIALAGVVFAPGSAGTIQEIFQDSAQNHYKSFGQVSPMVFLNRRYWTETKPVYPLMEHLASGMEYESMLAAFDSVSDVVDWIQQHR